MSKADYPYPDDEFDAQPDPTAPRGVHRAPRSAWSRWAPFLVVLVVAPLLAYGIVTFATRGGDLPIGGSDDGPAPTAAATSTAPATDDGDAPSGDASEPAPQETTEQPPAAEPDLATPVTVLNAAGIQGLAATAGQRLTSAGFTAVSPDNFSGTKPATSTVYYASEDERATADLVASTLGLDTVQLDAATAGSGVVVVLVTALG